MAALVTTGADPVGAATPSANDAGASANAPDNDPPTPQTLVYYNARIALRENRYKDVIRLWMLKNALESKGEDATLEGDFNSVLWAALARAGLCHDGLRDDDDAHGAGLWPLAMYNWMNKSAARQIAPGQPRAFTSFNTGFQQRYFSVHDVLSAEEINTARFFRQNCRRPYLALAQLGTPHWLDLDDRLSRGIMMRDLLERAQKTLKHERTLGEVVLEVRLFDLEVALVKLAKAQAKRETGILAQLAKATGVSEPAMVLFREDRLGEVRNSEYGAVLRRCLTWTKMDWLSLSLNRRLALFRESRDTLIDDVGYASVYERQLEGTLLMNVDAMIEQEDGQALSQWLGFAKPKDGSGQSTLIDAMTQGARGERLLSLGPEEGFRERSVIALRRGTDALAKGQPIVAMRSFALAMKRSEESRRAGDVHSLTKRWFAYVLRQHGVNAEVLAILDEFVSPIDKNELLEVLLWRAAFHADAESFDRIADRTKRGGSLDFRVRRLSVLADGDPGKMYREVKKELKKSPNAIYKFIQKLTEELATESLDVRLKNRVTLELGLQLLEEIAGEATRGLRRRIEAQQERMQTLLDGLLVYDESAKGRVRAATPGAESYAGSVRLAPADPMPWPFSVPSVQAPSPFTPIELTPVEWMKDGKRVFGWHINEQ